MSAKNQHIVQNDHSPAPAGLCKHPQPVWATIGSLNMGNNAKHGNVILEKENANFLQGTNTRK
jgi:hypothetical protein